MKGQFWQFVRFGLVGAVNTAVSYLLYLALRPLLPYFAAFTGSFLLGMVGSYFLNCYFTFRTRPSWKKFLLFPLSNVTSYVAQSVLVVALVQWLRVNDRIAPLIAAVLALPVTFLLSRLVLTGKAGSSDGSPKVEQLRPGAVGVEVVDQ